MSNKLVPTNPDAVMAIRSVTPNIVTLSTPFLRFGMIKIGGRGTIVRLTSGALAVFSPVALTPAVKTKLSEMGDNVRYIAASDMEHHIFLSEWASAYPSAHLIAPSGLPEKRAKVTDDPRITPLTFSTLFTKENKRSIKISEEFDKDFEYEYVDAHPNKELVFYYKPEKTIIEADLLFNLPATEQYSKSPEDPTKGFATKLFAGIQSTKGSAIWQKRMIWYMFAANDRQGFGESVNRMAKWEVERIVPCHGDVIETGAKGVFDKVFEWFLVGKGNAGKST